MLKLWRIPCSCFVFCGNAKYLFSDAGIATCLRENLLESVFLTFDRGDLHISEQTGFYYVWIPGAVKTEILFITLFIQDRLIFMLLS